MCVYIPDRMVSLISLSNQSHTESVHYDALRVRSIHMVQDFLGFLYVQFKAFFETRANPGGDTNARWDHVGGDGNGEPARIGDDSHPDCA